MITPANLPPIQGRKVVVVQIPIIGEKGKAQTRIVVFEHPPTKAALIDKLTALSNALSRSTDLKTGQEAWDKCVTVVETLPSEIFEPLATGNAGSMTHPVTFDVLERGRPMTRIFSARIFSVQ